MGHEVVVELDGDQKPERVAHDPSGPAIHGIQGRLSLVAPALAISGDGEGARTRVHHLPGGAATLTDCTGAPDGTPCDDGNACTLGDSCQTIVGSGYPYAGLIQGTDGALYGTASSGGSNDYGTVFKLNPDGTGFTVLLSLDYFTTGGTPYAGLIQGTDGALYGTASRGGSSGYGTVFKLNPDGTGFTVLANFDGSTTGGSPFAGLVQEAHRLGRSALCPDGGGDGRLGVL
jgi:uncharacterized repeat protein (TIGR03803 family)